MCHKALVFIVIFSLFLLPSPWGQTEENPELQGETTLTIIHISDLQSHICAEFDEGFGIADVSAVVDYVEQVGSPLVLGIGGLGSLHSDVDIRAEHSDLYVQILEELGYDAVVPWGSDFTEGLEPLIRFDEESEFPLLSANLLVDGKNPFASSALFDIEGIKVGVFALVSPEVDEIIEKGSIEGKENARELGLNDLLQTVEREELKFEQSGADVIVGVTDIPLVDLYESGYFSDEELDAAGAALAGHIDLVIEGSDARTYEKPRRLGRTVFTTTAGSGSVGGVEILVRGGEVAEVRTRLIGPELIEQEGLEPMPEVVRLLEQLSLSMGKEDEKKTAQAFETDASEEKATQSKEQEKKDGLQEEVTEEEEQQLPSEQRTLPPLELFLEPGLSLYSGAVGYGVSLGLMSDLEELFGFSSPLSNVMLGLLVRYEGLSTSSPDLKLNAWGPAVLAGYRFGLGDFFPDAAFLEDARVIPRLAVGGMSLSIERDGNSDYSDFSMHLAPGVVVAKALPVLEGLRAGVTAEYRMTFADKVLSNFHIGAFVSWNY